MVKGVTRRVIVMKAPEHSMFEEAIFFVNGDPGPGVTQEQLLQEAQQIAGEYVREKLTSKRRRHLPRWLWALIGAFPVASAWILTYFIAS